MSFNYNRTPVQHEPDQGMKILIDTEPDSKLAAKVKRSSSWANFGNVWKNKWMGWKSERLRFLEISFLCSFPTSTITSRLRTCLELYTLVNLSSSETIDRSRENGSGQNVGLLKTPEISWRATYCELYYGSTSLNLQLSHETIWRCRLLECSEGTVLWVLKMLDHSSPRFLGKIWAVCFITGSFKFLIRSVWAFHALNCLRADRISLLKARTKASTVPRSTVG